MTRFLIRSLFALCILFLVGFTWSHDDPFAGGIRYSLAHGSAGLETASLDETGEIAGRMIFALPGRHVIKMHVREVRENEEDEHESRSIKKSVVSSKYFAAIFCGQIMARFYGQIIPFSYRRHLVVRVFRL